MTVTIACTDKYMCLRLLKKVMVSDPRHVQTVPPQPKINTHRAPKEDSDSGTSSRPSLDRLSMVPFNTCTLIALSA